MEVEKGHKKVCLLTGASGSLGTEFCKEYSKHYNIVGIYNNRYPSVETQHFQLIDPLDSGNVNKDSSSIFAIKADLTNDQELDRIIELTMSRFSKIDVLINCAGQYLRTPFLESSMTSANTMHMMTLNVMAPLKLSTKVAQACWKNNRDENLSLNRSIINVSSIAAMKVFTNSGQSGYSATKSALNMITLHMAKEFSTIGVRVNAIAPNTFYSIVPMNRVTASIENFISGKLNGCIAVIDADKDYFIGEKRD